MIARLFAFGARVFTGAIPRWRGCAPEPRLRVYFANHSSNLDVVLLWSSLPGVIRARTRPIAAHDYWTTGAVRRWLATRVFRAVLIERRNVTRENNPLAPMVAALREGDSLIIFPEGGRNPSGEIGEFKPGIHHLAREVPDAEFVPVFIENLNRVLPKGEVLPVPILCSVHFGTPIRLEAGENKRDFLARARGAVLDLRAT
ncbi:MAG: lysophospholipid acyltransferase family protein [Chthoniobacteraceae bacterium]